ncbi:MAG TPA: hypothetical protein DFI00_01175 [Rhodospirillaceae bacterium]|nr:hypothetical protein [Alphaproteobacteria bacterium]OUT40836.1 MAG: hypothetical protein CBB62_00230 [Micavibrio sp. TMED2]HCI45883.1 hypothetical protein [Rhodospirillaceae bacterium]MAS47686.1 hypothetical protein [Alphaproteobacteria bacterium]MAX96442.1 hypothetical protein [Alphaproteobacteria bacterium]
MIDIEMKDRFSAVALELAQKPIMPVEEYPLLFNPPEDFQRRYCGSSMRHAFLFAAGFCNIMMTETEELLGPSEIEAFAQGWKFLDFGCGWGRITRLLALKYGQKGIYGLDVNQTALASASAAMPQATFALLENAPPSPYRDALIDIAISVSVFSHLSMEYQRSWATDIGRMVKSGGVVFVTYHGPWLLDMIEDFGNGNRQPGNPWEVALSRMSGEVSAYRESWADGRFTFMSTGGEAMGDQSAYGDVLVPRQCAEEIWGEAGFSLIKWIEDKERYPQCIAVLRKG